MAQIGTIRLQTQNNGTVSVPVFDTGDSGSSVYEFVRVQTGSGTGFIPVVDTSKAEYPYIRVHSQSHGTVAVHNKAFLVQIIQDNFNDNDLDTSIWRDASQDTPSGGGLCDETNDRLEFRSPGGGQQDRPILRTKNTVLNRSFDVRIETVIGSLSGNDGQLRVLPWWDGTSGLDNKFASPVNCVKVRYGSGSVGIIDGRSNSNVATFNGSYDTRDVAVEVIGTPSNFSVEVEDPIDNVVVSLNNLTSNFSNTPEYVAFNGREGSGRESFIDSTTVTIG